MKRIALTILAFIAVVASHAQTSTDSSLWVKMMYIYVDALKADIQYNKDLCFNKMIEEWKLPLKNICEKDSIENTKNRIEAFLNDSLTDCTESQREQANTVIRLLDSYEPEAQRMIASFKMTDPQMLENLEYCNSPTIVHTFSQMFLRKWFDDSQLPTFSESAIPYLAQVANELKQMVDHLCKQETATTELLHKFLDTKYRISKGYIKEEVKK
jgi:hypothetical protein